MPRQAAKTLPEKNMGIILKQDTAYQYETPEGVVWSGTMPRRTVLRIPESWVRSGIPADFIASEELI